MQKFGDVFIRRVTPAGRGIPLSIIALPIVIVLTIITRCGAQPQLQSTVSAPPKFEYEVISIKPVNPAVSNRRVGGGMHFTPDAFSVEGITLQRLIQAAYGGIDENQISGAPNWFASEKYDIDAKMESSVADEIQKLSLDDRTIARDRMLQTLLEYRFKLKVHRESKEVPIYTLEIAKNGPKLHEAKTGDTYPNGIKVPVGLPNSNVMFMQAGEVTAQAVTIPKLAGFLKMTLRCPVIDKTGLLGNYDFKLQFSPDRVVPQATSDGASNGQPALLPPDPVGPSIFTAVQEQLGLKLVPGRGPIQIIVVEHVERPSGN